MSSQPHQQPGVTAKDKLYKRPFDLTVLVLAHVLLFPLWLLLWTFIPLAIWLQDRGPIFYKQTRIGRGGKVFTIRKFRTMVPDAERMTGAVWATLRDPRITTLGRILRTTALDELPQVLNIWRGEMSIVGPRSERPELHAQFVQQYPGFEQRLAVRPGLTGLAQVKGEYNLPPNEKLVYDLDYIRRMSLWLDIKLITISAWNTVVGRWDRRAARKKR